MGYEYDSTYGSGGGYNYDTYNESDEVKNPMEVEPQPETNEYTGNEYNNIGSTPDNDASQSQDGGYDYSGYGY